MLVLASAVTEQVSSSFLKNADAFSVLKFCLKVVSHCRIHKVVEGFHGAAHGQ